MEAANKTLRPEATEPVNSNAGNGKAVPAQPVMAKRDTVAIGSDSSITPPSFGGDAPANAFVTQLKPTTVSAQPLLQPFNPVQKKGNNTGLPDNLKNGIEQLSGFDISDTRVHYNSSKPAQLQAHAYAQGTDIHVGPGQERHLPHEAWHVVQQKQGRVQPTVQMKGAQINDDTALEHEADVMGAKAFQLAAFAPGDGVTPKLSAETGGADIVQRKVGFEIEVVGSTITPEHPRNIAKGEALHQGAGWKLTPDSPNDGSWTPEYIISAIDETAGADELVTKMREVAAHAQNHLDTPAGWSNGANLEVESMDELHGNFHVTGGLRLSQISKLIKLLYGGGDVALAERAESTSLSGDNYKSIIALVGLQISDLAAVPENETHNGKSAKRFVGLLSRTDLGVAVAQVSKFTRKATFIADVLRVSGVAADTKLFKNTLPGAQGTGRTIDDHQDLTVAQWLDKLLTGHDYQWSETLNDAGAAFGFEKVGPPELGIINHRVDGIILELRAIAEQGEHSPPVEDWHKVALKYATLFQLLNKKTSIPDIVAALTEEAE